MNIQDNYLKNRKNIFFSENKDNSFLIITHYQKLLDYIKPDYVHVMVNGSIVKSGGSEIAAEIEKDGFQKFQ